MDLDIKTALITGASSGIGRATALWFTKRGAKVYACARRTSMLEELAKQAPGQIIPVALDVSKEAETVKKIQELDDQCGGLDLVLANAGVGDTTPAHNSTWEMVERVLKVNVMGAAATLTAVLPRMIARKRGRIAGVSSIAAYRGLGGISCYSGSKAFLSTFLESIKVDLYGSPVRATCIEIGYVKSEMSDKVAADEVTWMPFRMETELAADKIARAIVKGKGRIAFPWLHVLSAQGIAAIPTPLFQPLAQRGSRKLIAVHEASLLAKENK
jgi:NADP-dependent 3-hydroxy acid dehydrogenase YdfG